MPDVDREKRKGSCSLSSKFYRRALRLGLSPLERTGSAKFSHAVMKDTDDLKLSQRRSRSGANALDSHDVRLYFRVGKRRGGQSTSSVDDFTAKDLTNEKPRLCEGTPVRPIYSANSTTCLMRLAFRIGFHLNVGAVGSGISKGSLACSSVRNDLASGSKGDCEARRSLSIFLKFRA